MHLYSQKTSHAKHSFMKERWLHWVNTNTITYLNKLSYSMHYLILSFESLAGLFFSRFSFCMVLFLCFQEPPVARNVDVHTVVMENLTYLHRYLTITVNKKQMQDLQTIFTALRHSRLFGRASKYFFYACEITFSYSQLDRSFPYSEWDKGFKGQGGEWDENCLYEIFKLKKINLDDFSCFTLVYSKCFVSI